MVDVKVFENYAFVDRLQEQLWPMFYEQYEKLCERRGWRLTETKYKTLQKVKPKHKHE